MTRKTPSKTPPTRSHGAAPLRPAAPVAAPAIGARVLAIAGDDERRQLCEQAFRPPAFQLTTVAQAGTALCEIQRLRPHVVVAGLRDVLAGTRLLEAAGQTDPPTPLVALAPVATATARVCEGLLRGADDVITLPVAPDLLEAKVRAILRWGRSAGSASSRRGALSGQVGEDGTLRLVKYCEAQRLSGRLTISAGGEACWANFLGGEMVGAGGSDTTEGTDHLAALLDARVGVFTIEQRPLPPLQGEEETGPPEGPGAPPAAAPPEVSEVRTTRIEVAPHLLPYEIETRGTNRPNFGITTVVRRGETILRRTRRQWKRPLRDATDRAAARLEIDEQHERVATAVRAMAMQPAPPPTPPDTVDATLLCFAIHFVIEHAWEHLGTTITTSLLRRTQAALVRQHPSLASFQVGDRAQVELDLSRGPVLPAEATLAVASWLVAFLGEAREVVPEVSRGGVRQATSLMADALERVGFYQAFERVARAPAR